MGQSNKFKNRLSSSNGLRHVQRRHHELQDRVLQVGSPQVGVLEIAAGQIALLKIK
jgi:hypothetical protein